MVIKNDPRKILDLLSQPVPADEDTEFLDNLAKKVDFHDMPDHYEELKLDPKMNDDQEAMLREKSADGLANADEVSGPVKDLDSKTRRFFALFGGFRKGGHNSDQGDVPENIEFEKIVSNHEKIETKLPQVGDTQEEKEAHAEDLKRRQAYLDYQAKQEAEKLKKQGGGTDESEKKAHDAFVATFDQLKATK